MKVFIGTLLTLFSVVNGFCQTSDLELTKGKWHFCTTQEDSVSEFSCDEGQSTFKFKRSGKCIQTGLSITYFGKKIDKLKGRWELNGSVLTITSVKSGDLKIHEKTMTITLINEDFFYTPQKDWKTVYWLFKRIK